jgi:peptidoglycan hydrolase CwlO-like protein
MFQSKWVAGVLSVVVLGSVAAAIVRADDPKQDAKSDSMEKGRKKLPTPFNRLKDLSEDQRVKIMQLETAMREKEAAIRAETRTAQEAVLTSDQRKELIDMLGNEKAEKAAVSAEKRAKSAEDKAKAARGKIGGASSTQPSGGGDMGGDQ